MNPLANFRWYRRARGGYWIRNAKGRWLHADRPRPMPDGQWQFYPWAQKDWGNGIEDVWHEVEPCYLVPYSQWIADTLGTNDMACVLGLIREARNAHETWAKAHHPDSDEGIKALGRLRIVLAPFANAKIVPDYD